MEQKERRDFRVRGRLLGGRDSGGRFMRPPSIYWHKYECAGFPERCRECVRQTHHGENCGATGIYEETWVRGPDGEYHRKRGTKAGEG